MTYQTADLRLALDDLVLLAATSLFSDWVRGLVFEPPPRIDQLLLVGIIAQKSDVVQVSDEILLLSVKFCLTVISYAIEVCDQITNCETAIEFIAASIVTGTVAFMTGFHGGRCVWLVVAIGVIIRKFGMIVRGVKKSELLSIRTYGIHCGLLIAGIFL